MKGRMIRSALAAALMASGAYGAISAGGASASVPQGYTEVSQQSSTYVPGGDIGVACPGATPKDGIGGACFTPDFDATYVDANLADQVSQNAAGVLSFNDKTLNGNTIASVSFCGDSGPVKIPDGTAAIFVTAAGPATNDVEPGINGLGVPNVSFSGTTNCGPSSFATTGTATLTQLVPTTTTTTTTATTTT